MFVTCLEGHCILENNAGRVELTEGLSASIEEEGKAPTKAMPINEEEVSAWQEANPEIEPWLQGTPIAPPQAPPPPPVDQNSNPPPMKEVTYGLNNNCSEGNWHWDFTGPITKTFSIPPGGSASGTLPPGDYIATDSLEGGHSSHTGELKNGGHLIVSACPD
ncbi:MAG: hypothetical protein HN392_12305 [Anaerolineae bacterium]|nr:hypothetical protein [Anaerolineae bacterium]MBT7074883.1 hypothetical protein [Anaerolineae bacterium]